MLKKVKCVGIQGVQMVKAFDQKSFFSIVRNTGYNFKTYYIECKGSLCLIGTRQKVRETILKSTQNQPPMDLYIPTEVVSSIPNII